MRQDTFLSMKNYLRKYFAFLLFTLSPIVVMAKKDTDQIVGIVLDEKNQPLEGAMIVIDGTLQLFTNQEGQFNLPYTKRKEPSDVIAFLKGFKVKAWYYNPDNGSVKVVMTEGNVMGGRVTDQSGKPLGQTDVYLQGFKTEKELTTDKHGYFRLLLPNNATLHNAFVFKIHRRLHNYDHYNLNPGIGFYNIIYSGIPEPDKKKSSHIQHLVLVHTDYKPIANTSVIIDNANYTTNAKGEITLNDRVPKHTQFNLSGYTILRSEYYAEEEKLHLIIETGGDRTNNGFHKDNSPMFGNDTIRDGNLADIDKDFEKILKNLQNEKDLVNNTNDLLTSEVDKIQHRLGKGEKLSEANKKKLQDYLARIQTSIVDIHQEEDSIYGVRNDDLIYKLQGLLLEKDSLNKITQARLLKVEQEKAKAEETYRKKLFVFSIVGVCLAILGIIGYAIALKIRRQKDQLAVANLQLEESKTDIENKKAQIDSLYLEQTDSIRTALVIQQAILPPQSFIKNHLPEHFIFYKPKDIVSGDFYWFDVKDDYAYIAAVDCTGHGVAGGFTSMLGYSLLNLSLQNQERPTPAAILDKLNEGVIRSLRQGTDDSQSKDGMDITLCKIRLGDHKMEVAGGGNPIYIIRNNELLQYKTDRFAIGIPKLRKDIPKFNNYEVEIQKGDLLYIFSDGYADQLGGEDGMQKFMYNRFRDLLMAIHHESLEVQKQKLEQAISDWIGHHEQIDDMTVIGIRI